MKGKKEYLILLVLIAALGTYLYFRNSDQVHYQIPKLGEIDIGKITRIEIANKGQAVALNRKDNTWLIEPKGYPADTARIEKMLKDIGGIKITELVSQSKNYSRYELDEKERITLRAYAGTGVSRELHVGKVAPSFRHTYVMLPKDANVYQAEGNFREDFQQSADSLRDKKVLAFDPGEIRKITITMGKEAAVFTRNDVKAGGGKPEKKPPVTVTTWTDTDGREVGRPDVNALMSSVSSLECSKFLDDVDKAGLGSPEVRVTFSGTKEYSLSLYAKQGGKTPASSSGSAYVFFIPEYQQEGILKALKTCMGKK